MMIKAAATFGKKKVLILGLSRENTERLHNGEPIKVDLEALGLVGPDVILFAGETEEEMKAELENQFGKLPTDN
jgi:ABC-type Fe3+-citrate transport system substrate-binding protein